MYNLALMIYAIHLKVTMIYEQKIKDLEDFWTNKFLDLRDQQTMHSESNEAEVKQLVKRREVDLEKIYDKKLR